VLAEEGGSRAGAGYRNAAAFNCRTAFATGVPPSKVESLSWLPPVKKTPVARLRRSRRPLSSASRRVSKSSEQALRAPISPKMRSYRGPVSRTRLAVGMTAMSAAPPPARSTKRRKICGEFSFSSAPPIGMIHPAARLPPPYLRTFLHRPRLLEPRSCHAA